MKNLATSVVGKGQLVHDQGPCRGRAAMQGSFEVEAFRRFRHRLEVRACEGGRARHELRTAVAKQHAHTHTHSNAHTHAHSHTRTHTRTHTHTPLYLCETALIVAAGPLLHTAHFSRFLPIRNRLHACVSHVAWVGVGARIAWAIILRGFSGWLTWSMAFSRFVGL